MLRSKKHLCLTLFCLIFTVFYFGGPFAEGDTGTEQAESREKGASSFSIKKSNVQTAPAVTPAGQPETRESGKSAPSGEDQPHLSIDTRSYDAGELWEGEDIIHTFTIRNTGTGQLTISNVKPG